MIDIPISLPPPWAANCVQLKATEKSSDDAKSRVREHAHFVNKRKKYNILCLDDTVKIDLFFVHSLQCNPDMTILEITISLRNSVCRS